MRDEMSSCHVRTPATGSAIKQNQPAPLIDAVRIGTSVAGIPFVSVSFFPVIFLNICVFDVTSDITSAFSISCQSRDSDIVKVGSDIQIQPPSISKVGSDIQI